LTTGQLLDDKFDIPNLKAAKQIGLTIPAECAGENGQGDQVITEPSGDAKIELNSPSDQSEASVAKADNTRSVCRLAVTQSILAKLECQL